MPGTRAAVDPHGQIPSGSRRRRRRRRRDRILTWLGSILILVGLGFLGYVAWEYFGTNIVSKHRQAEVKQQLKLDWGKGVDGNAIGLLRVPRFGKHYEVPIIKGFGEDQLAQGIAWYPKGAKPGQIGNFVIAGHRVTHGQPFHDFLKLKKGDLVTVETRTNVYTYKLTNDGNKITVDFHQSWVLKPVPKPGPENPRPTKATITMLTCSELFHTNNRSVAFGTLVSTVTKSAKTGGSSE